MSSRFLIRACGILVLLMWLWPVAHIVLSRQYHTNPWRLYGFAMYCTDQWIDVMLVDLTSGRPQQIQHLPPREREVFEEYRRKRDTLGSLASSRDLAEAVMARYPEMRSLGILVYVSRLDGVTHRIEEYRYSEWYERRNGDVRLIRTVLPDQTSESSG